MDRQRVRHILILALPIVGGMVSQNIVNLTDTAMVGRLGKAAVAGVGLSSFVNFLFTSVVTGLSSGVQAIAARRVGEGRTEASAESLHGGLVLAIAIGLVVTVAGWLAVPTLFPYLNDDPAVIAVGVPYLRMRLLGTVSVGIHFTFRGFWNGVGRPGLYFRTIVIMHAVNILLSWCLIYGNLGLPELGAVGAGVGTAAASWIGVAVYAWLAWRFGEPYGIGRAGMPVEAMRSLARLALPGAVQQLLFAAGLTALFKIIGLIGTDEVAAANVLINITMTALLPGIGLGLVAASLVGQALGRNDPEDARRWGWDTVGVATIGMVMIGAVMVVAPTQILAVFLPTEPETLALAVWPLRIVGGLTVFDAVGMVLMQALLGAGAVRTVMAVTLCFQWGVALPAAWLVGPYLGYGLIGVWLVQIAQRAAQAAVLAWVWQRGQWANIRV